MFSPEKKPRSSLPGTVKDEVETRAKELIETLKPKHVPPPPQDASFNYLTDITTNRRSSSLLNRRSFFR